MKRNAFPSLPEARSEGIIVREFEGEVLVYDLERDKAHCLNPVAAQIWRCCDGRTTVREMSAALSHQERAPINEDVVILGLEELRRSHLLLESDSTAQCLPSNYMPRREAVRRIGLGAAIALPLVASMTVPTAVEAAVSCKASCMPCATGECCSGVCGNSTITGCPGSGNKCL